MEINKIVSSLNESPHVRDEAAISTMAIIEAIGVLEVQLKRIADALESIDKNGIGNHPQT